MAKLEYDEDGKFFGHFCIAIYAFFLIPITYYILKKYILKSSKQCIKYVCECNPCQEKRLEEKKKNNNNYMKILILTLIWLGFAWLVYKVKTTKFTAKSRGFDPFEILGIDSSATPKEIKTAYRHLVLKKHPDHGGDVDTYIKISKAYKALTNEIARENYEKYGNPDGPLSPSLGIALPSWLIDKKHSRFILLIYFLAIILGLPIILITWWYNSKNYYSDKLLQTTLRLFVYFIRQSGELKWKRILTILSGSEEFSPSYSNYMSIKFNERDEIANLVSTLELKNKREGIFNLPYSIKARVLIYCQLMRIKISDSLQKCMDNFLIKLLLVLTEFQNILTSFVLHQIMDETRFGPTSESVFTCIRLSSFIIQGQIFKDSPLIQLPHVTPQNIITLMRKKKSVNTVAEFVRFSTKDQELLYKYLTIEQKNDIFSSFKAMPYLELSILLRIDDVFNPTFIEARSFINVVFILKRISLYDYMMMDTTNSDLSQIDNNNIFNNFTENQLIEACESNKKIIRQPIYFVHAPRFCIEKKEGWWAYITNEKGNLVVAPFYFTFTSNQEIFDIQLYSSSINGRFKYKCWIVSDSYCDQIYSHDIELNVIQPAPIIEDHPQWEDLSDYDNEIKDDDILTDNEVCDPIPN